jgi:hypothetical protein
VRGSVGGAQRRQRRMVNWNSTGRLLTTSIWGPAGEAAGFSSRNGARISLGLMQIGNGVRDAAGVSLRSGMTLPRKCSEPNRPASRRAVRDPGGCCSTPVPAKELCRPWRSLLSDPQFIAAHTVGHPGPLITAAIIRIVAPASCSMSWTSGVKLLSGFRWFKS